MHYIHHTLHRFSEYKPSGGNVFSNLQPNWQLEFVIETKKAEPAASRFSLFLSHLLFLICHPCFQAVQNTGAPALPSRLLCHDAVGTHMVAIRRRRIHKKTSQRTIRHRVKIVGLSADDLPSASHGTQRAVVSRI